MLDLKTAQDLSNAMGIYQYYGFSPAMRIHFTKGQDNVNITFIQSKDLRHLYKSIQELSTYNKIKVNFIENNINNILRNVMLFQIIYDETITLREKVETFLDFYYNQLLCQKTIDICKKYIDINIQEINDTKKCANGVFDFSQLKYRERDQILERLEFWKKLNKDTKYLQENCFKFRDDRLRYLYKDRYDHKNNLIDGDYVWGIKWQKYRTPSLLQNKFLQEQIIKSDSDQIKEKAEESLVLRFWEYQNFRDKGIAYAIHSNEDIHRIFNFSVLDYAEGKQKQTKNPCEVLGYWGDIVVSPFYTFGLMVDDLDEKKKFYKIQNENYYYYNEKFSEYFVEKMIKEMNEQKDIYQKLQIQVYMQDDLQKCKKIFQQQHVLCCSYSTFQSQKDFIMSQTKEHDSILYLETPFCYTFLDNQKRKQLIDQLKIDLKDNNMNIALDLDHHLLIGNINQIYELHYFQILQ